MLAQIQPFHFMLRVYAETHHCVDDFEKYPRYAKRAGDKRSGGSSRRGRVRPLFLSLDFQMFHTLRWLTIPSSTRENAPMNVIVKSGIWIGVLCAIWMLVVGYTGWYKDPVLLNLFYLVVLIELGVIFWGLKQTAAGLGYGGQVAAGTLMAVMGGAIIIVVSILFTTVLFPNYFSELQAIHEQMLRNAGKTEAEIAAEVQAAASMQTPVVNAITGFVATVVTGFIASLIIAAFLRKKPHAA
jgi:hypothetical protein